MSEEAVDKRDRSASCEGQPATESADGAQDVAARELAEHNALAIVFDDVRARSADGRLVEPVRWAEQGMVPDHLTPDEFEMFVYEYLEDDRAAREAAAAQQAQVEKPVYRSATRAVGVPPVIGARAASEDAPAPQAAETLPVAPVAAPKAPEALAEEVLEQQDTAADDGRSPFAGLEIPAGYQLVELEGEWVLVPTDEEPAAVQLSIECENIVALVGAHSYYLYDRAVMTDTFAHWAFLAAEDNVVVTFADCVREDSRVYPRPMPAQSLKNDPFHLTDQEIQRAWDEARESGLYPDLQRTVASNGDVYYFSTDYLSPTYAASLAEWDAVERYANV